MFWAHIGEGLGISEFCHIGLITMSGIVLDFDRILLP